jgi:hypothetical protein
VPAPRSGAAVHGPAAAAPGHEVTVHDGRFSSAECSCGWRSAARRHRATARQEARDHVLLYADGSELSSTPAPGSATSERAVSDERTASDAGA